MKANPHRRRRSLALIIVGLVISWVFFMQDALQTQTEQSSSDAGTTNIVSNPTNSEALAIDSLDQLEVKGRAPKTGYARSEFGNGWADWKSCDTRQRILARDLVDIMLGDDGCTVLSGTLNDSYTGKTIDFKRGSGTSSAVQIDHVVALSDAWRKGAQALSAEERLALANDDLELIAVDGTANQQKSDGDAATWLPSNKAFRCQYVARQIAVKIKYSLWVTQAEYDAMSRILETCPDERLPSP